MKSLQGVLAKEMDRKEFLFYAGLILLTLTGIAGMTKSLQTIFNTKVEQGYGATPYGK